MRSVILALAFGCGVSSPPTTTAEPPDPCGRQARLGGEYLERSDGVELWYRVAGPPNAPLIAYLHGGPGYNAYAFERSAGEQLEAHFRMLYFDQRGAGRSSFDGDTSQYGMAPTVEDLDQLRAHLGAERLVLMGHSFGAIVAAAYAHRYPERVAAVVQIDSAPDVGTALANQVAAIDAIADDAFPEQAAEVHEIAAREATAFVRLGALYQLLGRLPMQRHLHYASDDAQERMEALDAEPGFLGCTSSKVVAAFEREGYLGDAPPNVAVAIEAPTLLVAGRASRVIGEAAITEAAARWGAELAWVDDAGHFVYFEKPEAFVQLVTEFVEGALTR